VSRLRLRLASTSSPPPSLTAPQIGLVGVALASTYVGGGTHFLHTHGAIGLVITLLASVLQPFAVLRGHVEVHHKNGSVVVLLGLCNCFLGLMLIGAPRKLQFAYGLWVLSVIIFFVFDPLQMRAKRQVQSAQLTGSCELPPVDVGELLKRPSAGRANAVSAIAAGDDGPAAEDPSHVWRQHFNAQAGEIRFRRPA
jgi:hypothetical protein